MLHIETPFDRGDCWHLKHGDQQARISEEAAEFLKWCGIPIKQGELPETITIDRERLKDWSEYCHLSKKALQMLENTRLETK